VTLQTNTSELFNVLNTLSIGMMIFNTDGEVILSNHAADAIVQSKIWLDLADQRLRVKNTRTIDFDSRLRDALDGHAANDHNLILLNGNHSDDSLLLAFTPTLSPDKSDDNVVCMIIDPHTDQEIDRTLLKQLYGLTEAESDIAALLARGLNYSEIAEQRGVAVSTIRSYSKSIFRKLKVNCRSEVVRKVHSLAIPVNQRKN